MEPGFFGFFDHSEPDSPVTAGGLTIQFRPRKKSNHFFWLETGYAHSKGQPYDNGKYGTLHLKVTGGRYIGSGKLQPLWMLEWAQQR